MNINIYPSPWDLRYFQEVAVTENFSRAAERLGVGQPTLSLAVKRLENTLDTQLFLRRNRGLTLTASGKKLLKESNELLKLWEGIVSDTKKSETDLVGNFSLGCHQAVGLYALTPFLRKLYKKYPDIEIRLKHGLSREVCEQVISGNLDFAYVVNPMPHLDLVIKKVANDTVGFWRSQNSLEDVLICDPALTQSQDLIKKMKKKKTFKRTITTSSLELVAKLVESGAGVGILPGRVAKALSSRLSFIEGSPTYKDEVTFVYRVDLPKTASNRLLIKMLSGIKI